MAKLSGKEIKKLARSIVNENPGGIRYSELVEKISQQSPETPKNTVHGSVWNLDTIFPNEIAKPSRGLFTPVAKAANPCERGRWHWLRTQGEHTLAVSDRSIFFSVCHSRHLG
jgi:hypothetical protein